MLNEKQSPGGESRRNLTGLLKNVTRDVVTPSLNSPGSNTTDDGAKEKTTPNSCSREQLGEARGKVNESRDYLCRPSGPKPNVACDKPSDGPNAVTRDAHAASTHEARDKNDTNTCEKLGENVRENSRGSLNNSRNITRASHARESTTRNPRDLGGCLNTLDYLKAVLQSTMVCFYI